MAGAHPVSAVVIELAHKKGMIVGLRHPPRLRLAGEPLLDPLPDLNVHDPRMKAVMGLPFVAQPSDIDWIRQDPIQVTSRDRYAAGRPAAPAHRGGGANVLGVESGLEAHHAAEFDIAVKQIPHEFGFALDHMESAVFDL